MSEAQAIELDKIESVGAKKRQEQGFYRCSAMSPAVPLEGPRIVQALQTDNMTADEALVALGRPVPQPRCKRAANEDDPSKPMRSLDIEADQPDTDTPAGRKIPATIFMRVVVILHLFSGPRRTGDLQEALESSHINNGFTMLVISLDIAISRKGDILNPSRMDWWVTQVRCKYVIGAFGGPPCETWSAARLLDGGPPPLRSPDWPWGMPQVENKHHKQLEIGSALLLAAIRFLAELLIAGGFFGGEHPSNSGRDGHISIWDLDIFKRLLQSEAVQCIEFDQCMTGQTVVGPTTLVLVRLPSVADGIRGLPNHGKCNHGYRVHRPARGKKT